VLDGAVEVRGSSSARDVTEASATGARGEREDAETRELACVTEPHVGGTYEGIALFTARPR
jgi:hypothetical protein